MDRAKHETARLSRRQFLRLVPAAAGVAIVGRCGNGDELVDPQAATGATPVPLAERYVGAVGTPEVAPDPTLLRFFSPHQAETVEAITARILPGTLEDPGAREAGVVVYIDHVLAYEEGYVQPAYLEGPFAEVYEGDEPPAGAGSDVVWVSADEIGRYGYQSPLSPAEVYRVGLEALDSYAQDQYGADFVDLSEEQQDAIVEAMVEDEATGFEPFSAAQFFHVLRRHTKEGMFSDPIYGGNRNMVGWRLIRFPGAQRAYTPGEIGIEGVEREPWDLGDLPAFHYSRPRSPTPPSPGRGTGGGLEGRDGQDSGHGH